MTTRHATIRIPKPGRRARSLALAFLATATLSMILVPRAEAGTYPVAQCWPDVNRYAPDQFFYTTPKQYPAYRNRDSDCQYNELDNRYESNATGVIEGPGGGSPGDVGGMIWQVPYGTKITRVTVKARLYPASGHVPQIYFENANATAQQMIVSGDTGGIRTYTADTYRDRFVAAIRCIPSGSICGWGGARAAVQDLRMWVHDWDPPRITGWGGSLVDGKWKRGSGYSLSVSGHDYGSGIHYFTVTANGSTLASSGLSCEGSSSGYFLRTNPCYGGQSRGASWSSLSTQAGGLREGTNTIRACAYDVASGSSPNEGCENHTVRVDNVAPGGPSALNLAGSDGWTPINNFDLSWTNQDQSCDCASLAATHYRITGPGHDTGDQRIGLSSKLDNRTVPRPGEYTFGTWSEDSAGNHDGASAATVQLKFDDTVPPPTEALSTGWLERNDFPHVLRWHRPDSELLGPSSLKGYAVSIDDDPHSDPCEADGDAECSAAEVNNPGGADDTSEVLEDFRNGDNHFIHVVPVSGAGVRSPQVGHTRMRVDKRDPQTDLSGVPAGWVNHDVRLTATATDSLSGMEPDSDFPDEPQPLTAIRIGEGATESAAGPRVSTEASAEGAHDVRYWARDLAGNESNGELEGQEPNNPPGIAVVRIDKTAPQVAFQNAESKDDPSLITAPFSDALSGVVDGEIDVRPEGGGEWMTLRTKVSEGQLEARVPDNLRAGRYEMRAKAVDAAGNAAFSRQRQDGSAMAADLPLKAVIELSGGLGRREKNRVTLRYGRPTEVSGVLRTETGRPLAGEDLSVVEALGPGSRSAHSNRNVQTDARGHFSAPLSGGPSRTVSVHYAGDRRNFGADLTGLRMKVRAAVLRFKAPRKVTDRQKLMFRGRVGALGVRLGKLGKIVELQYLKAPGDWKTIRTGKARGKGRFRIGYRLRNTYSRPARVVFRARVPKERRWPYAGAARSKSRATVIRPHR